jgi:outer membrane protein OmpA-like peptidoglycan-associated protein
MRCLALAIILALIALPAAADNSGQGWSDLPHLVTTWGATSPNTDFHWTYTTSPTPAFRGTPGQRLNSINFGPNSTQVDRQGWGSLVKTRDALQASGTDLKGVKLLIVGYSDGVVERGTRAHSLGLHRAEVVRSELVRLGFRRANIEVSSFGDRYSTATPGARFQERENRRVAIWELQS